MYSLREGKRGAYAPRQLSGRGLSYWTDGQGDDRVLYVTPGYRLIALNAKTGNPISSFGEDGIVDLKVGVVWGNEQPIDLATGEIGLHSTPLVAKDIVLIGSAMKEGMTIETHNNTKGLVRAYDVRTGKLLWTFNTIPRPGEFGNDTWLDNSWETNGNTGVWTQMTVDEELGLAYLPVESPTSDFYGGHRPGPTTCSAKVSSASISRPGSASGTSNSCITRSGIMTCPRHRSSPTSSSTVSRSKLWPCRASRATCTFSIV